MPAPSRSQVLAFWDRQPAKDRSANGFVKGSDSRAAFIEWYQHELGAGDVVSPRGVLHAGSDAVRGYALYVLERAVKARRKSTQKSLTSIDKEGS